MYEIHSIEQLLKLTALAAAVISIIILLWYLVRRPPLGRLTKVMLLFGLGVMPIGVALTGNIAGESCYNCHADYQLFGTMTTKVNGLKHLFYYLTEYANTGPYGEGGKPIHMYKGFQNGMCTRCHSTTAPRWLANQDHAGMLDDIRKGDAKCVDCHSGEKIHPRAFAHGGAGKPPVADASQPGAAKNGGHP